ncbi:MAG: hypothetical protein ACYC9L_16960 [Sulfuricaulis sp.]
METVKFVNQAAQGDCYIKRVDKLPAGVKLIKAVNGQYIVAHSESGHHHVIDAVAGCEVYEDPKDPMTLYLNVIDATEVTLRHLRSFDTHKPIAFLKGLFRFRRARERTPEGWRKVED